MSTNPATEPAVTETTTEPPSTVLYLCSCAVLINITDRLKHELSNEHIEFLYYNN